MADVIVGRFALIDLIARGGSGAVWRAWDAKHERLCAAKVLLQRDSADLMRFVREKGVTFDHPNLLTPYGWGAEDAHVVIAMPLATGGTLDSLLRKQGPLGEAAVVVILQQMLRGLAHIHAEGWIHRDVKPANIMFRSEGFGIVHSVLSDFGIAVHRDDVRFTGYGFVNGTPGYMAPELFSLVEPAPTADLYALGVVAMVALNGKITLHDGAYRADELDSYLRGISPQLAHVIRRLVEPDVNRRYASADDALADMPYVAPSTRLTLRSGKPLHIGDLMPPLPPDAPGQSDPKPPKSVQDLSMEQIRSGRGVPSAPSAGTPSTPAAWAPPAPVGQPDDARTADRGRHASTSPGPQSPASFSPPATVAGAGVDQGSMSAPAVPSAPYASPPARHTPVPEPRGSRLGRAGWGAIALGTTLAIVLGGGVSALLLTLL
ncbi:MAG: protein kinase [Dermabacter sp.]|nr:protein kinase [Dermabacter sp.]